MGSIGKVRATDENGFYKYGWLLQLRMGPAGENGSFGEKMGPTGETGSYS